jgi:hypothetical protein
MGLSADESNTRTSGKEKPTATGPTLFSRQFSFVINRAAAIFPAYPAWHGSFDG